MSKVKGKAEVAVQSLTVEQREMIEAMPKPWQSRALSALVRRQDSARNNVLERYQLGEDVREMTNEATYGEKAVPMLAAFLGEPANTLWQCQQFARSYSREDLESLLARADSANVRLSWSHFDILAGVSNVKVKKTLEIACLKERLTAAELRTRLQRAAGRGSGGGRAPIVPKSPAVGLDQIEKSYQQYASRWTGWEQVVFSGLLDIGPDQVDRDLVSSVDRAMEAQLDLQRLAGQSVEMLEKVRHRLLDVLPAADDSTAAEGDASPAAAEDVEDLETGSAAEAEPAAAPEPVMNRIARARQAQAVAKVKPGPVTASSAVKPVSAYKPAAAPQRTPRK